MSVDMNLAFYIRGYCCVYIQIVGRVELAKPDMQLVGRAELAKPDMQPVIKSEKSGFAALYPTYKLQF